MDVFCRDAEMSFFFPLMSQRPEPEIHPSQRTWLPLPTFLPTPTSWVDVTLGIWRKGLQGRPPPPANPSILTVPALGVAFPGSGLDLWGGGQCPGLGVWDLGVWNGLFL